MLQEGWSGALYSQRFDAAALSVDALEALVIVREIQASAPGLNSWINFPLFNQTGDSSNLLLGQYQDPALPTAYAARLPYSTKVVRELAAEGWDLEYARIAVLFERDVLRSHVDMYTSVRFVIPLTEHADYRYVFGEHCVSMRVGELWGIDPDTCHGAANIGWQGSRVALLVDVRPSSSRCPTWFRAKRNIPSDRQIHRSVWNDDTRALVRQAARARKIHHGIVAAEREWFFVPFEYAITPHHAYEELIAFCRVMAEEDQAAAAMWADRAEFWEKHNCVCVVK